MKMARAAPVSLCDQVFSRLADEIVLGRLSPGMHLDEQSIAQRCGVSRTPVREALKLLAVTGLVHYQPNRGSVVRSLSTADLDGMFEAIAELESACARHAALRMSPEEQTRLKSCHIRSQQALESNDMEMYDSTNRSFHALICEGAHNPYLQESMATLRRRLMPFRRGQFVNRSRLQQSYREHCAVTEALLGRDAEAAHRAMRAHLLSARTGAAWLLPDA